MKPDTLPLSVVIPTHNGRASIIAAVSSVLAQTQGEFELVIVCDGDGTRTRELLQGFNDERLRVIEQPRSGVSTARNRGASVSEHSWITFLDDDDTARPNWLSCLAAGARDGLTGVVTAELAFWMGERLIEVRGCHLCPTDPTMEASTILPGGFAVRRDVFERVGGFDELLSYSENQDLGLRILDHPETSEEVVHVAEVVVDFHREPGGTRVQRYGRAPADAATVFLDRYSSRLASDRSTKASLLRIISRANRNDGNRRAALLAAAGACRAQPGGPSNYRSIALAVLPKRFVSLTERRRG